MKSLAKIAGFSGLALFGLQEYKRNLDCCGIIACISKEPKAMNVCLEGIQILQNRGYDSAGLATIDSLNKTFHLSRFISSPALGDSIDQLVKESPKVHSEAYVGVGHTRWATCGAKTVSNAHPHLDDKKKVALVHNGTLDNVHELKTYLNSQGITLRSDTDTELIAQMIGLEVAKGAHLLEAVKNTLPKLHGFWGLVVLHSDNPNQVVISRKGSPIHVGLDEDNRTIYAASESVAYQNHTLRSMIVEENETILLDLSDQKLLENLGSRLKICTKQTVDLKPREEYKCFMEQEIYEIPDALERTSVCAANMDEEPVATKPGELSKLVKGISSSSHLIVVACGSSFYAAQYAKHYFQKLKVFDYISIEEASEIIEDDFPKKDTVVLAVSQSGETADILRVIRIANKHGLITICLVNAIGSQLTHETKAGVYLRSGRETSVPATKSFICQIGALFATARWMAIQELQDPDFEHPSPALLEDAMKEITDAPEYLRKLIPALRPRCKVLAQELMDCQHLYIVAKGSFSAIAREGALKLKEVTYLHAEALVAGELKHGPIAMIESEKPLLTKIMLIINEDETQKEMELTLSEVKARNAYTIVLTDSENIQESKINFKIQVPKIGIMNGLFYTVVFHLVSLELAYLRGINPDKPRNLAKTVTVL